MNPKTDILIVRDSGIFSISPVGRIGTYESAVRRHRSRARKYWIIEEAMTIPVSNFDGSGRKSALEREDLGHFKTKKAAIQFMVDYAAAHPGARLEGDPQGYPRLIVVNQDTCRHKFIDSTHCLKCGWKPETDPKLAMMDEHEARRSEVIAEHKGQR
jgi:hypothetical protein